MVDAFSEKGQRVLITAYMTRRPIAVKLPGKRSDKWAGIL
jgi:hypothetical protein